MQRPGSLMAPIASLAALGLLVTTPLGAHAVPHADPEAQPKPNVLLIVAGTTRLQLSSKPPISPPDTCIAACCLPTAVDDFGHNDIGYHAGEIPTPNMDWLAGNGVKLESFYTQPICSATRSSIMSGRYVIRTGFQHNNREHGH